MPDQVVPTIGIVADLTFEVGGGDRRTRAHLSGGPRTLVLDVDDPALLLRSLPRRHRRLPATALTDPLSGTTIQVRSGGSALGSVRFERGRRAIVRPTGSGVAVALGQVARLRAVRIGVGLLAGVLVAVRLRRRGSRI